MVWWQALLPSVLASQTVFKTRPAQLPVDKVYGVNLGSWLLIEPYMLPNEWDSMGGNSQCSCGQPGCTGSEWDLVNKIGQDAANSVFKKHWDTWFTEDDAKAMAKAGLNTVRIPLGTWIVENTKDDQDLFPEGGFPYLTKGLGWLADAGIYAFIDIHAVPGQSTPNNPFSGRCNSQPTFFDNKDDNFIRAANAAANFTESAHTLHEWRTVRSIGALNEPPANVSVTPTPNYDTYLDLFTSTVRNKEKDLDVPEENALSLGFMSYKWQFGGDHVNPSDHTSGPSWYDEHLYFSFGGVAPEQTQDSYLDTACTLGGDRAQENKDLGDVPVLFGEYWLATEDGVPTNPQFYKDFSDALRIGWEKGNGWMFWSWKFEGDDPLRDYQDAMAAGYIPKNASEKFNPKVCDGHQD